MHLFFLLSLIRVFCLLPQLLRLLSLSGFSVHFLMRMAAGLFLCFLMACSTSFCLCVCVLRIFVRGLTCTAWWNLCVNGTRLCVVYFVFFSLLSLAWERAHHDDSHFLTTVLIESTFQNSREKFSPRRSVFTSALLRSVSPCLPYIFHILWLSSNSTQPNSPPFYFGM